MDCYLPTSVRVATDRIGGFARGKPVEAKVCAMGDPKPGTLEGHAILSPLYLAKRFRSTPLLQVNIHDAKTQLSKLIKQVCRGEEVIIAKAGKPVARLTAFEPLPRDRKFGVMRGKAHVDQRFFEPLPEEEIQDWE